jgi:toxin ParE1/3/4
LKILWSPSALASVEAIGAFIAQDNRAAAERWVIGVFDATARLENFPRSGRVVPEVGATDVREVIFGSYRLIYNVGEHVEILAIVHGRQLFDPKEIDNSPS